MHDLKEVNSLVNDVYQLIKKTINNTNTENDWQALLDEGNRIALSHPDLQKLAVNLVLGYVNFMEKNEHETQKQRPDSP